MKREFIDGIQTLWLAVISIVLISCGYGGVTSVEPSDPKEGTTENAEAEGEIKEEAAEDKEAAEEEKPEESEEPAESDPSDDKSEAISESKRVKAEDLTLVISLNAQVAQYSYATKEAINFEDPNKMDPTDAQLLAFDPVHKLVTEHCAACHVANIGFANEDKAKSMQITLDNTLINETTPDESLLVLQIKGGHNYWSDPEQDAAAMLDAINQFLQ